MIRRSFGGWLALALAAWVGSAAAADPAPNTLTEAEKAAGWKLLFDGKTFDGWRGYKKEKVGDGWKIVDGAMTRVGGGGDVITTEQYGAYELSLEYKISKGGNSGLMFHVTEDEGAPYQTGPEIQVQDNKDGHDPQKAGWLYQLYKPDVDATKPVGEWNQIVLKLVPAPGKSEVFMNGVKYYEFVKGSDDWNERVAKSKFKAWAKFGKPTKGFICLQDHGNEVAYRNIKILPLDPK